MLRLWPEAVEVYLFPGVSWLKRNGRVMSPLVCPPALQASAFLDQLRTVLDAQDPPLKTGTKIVLTVSDTLANIAAMPWQSSLHSSAEIDAYASACFQHAGHAVGDDWTMQAQFRNFEAMGLAFALPTAWLTELLSELEMRKLSLASVLPLSAAIYFGVKVKVGAWPSIVLAREHFRHVAYVFSPTGMLGYDAEANIGNPEQSAHRLGSRITAQYGVCRRRSTWTAHAEAQAIENPMLLGLQAWKTTG